MSKRNGAKLYPVIAVRALIVEDHGDDLIVELWHKRGSTRCQVDRAQVMFALEPPELTLAASRIDTQFL
jgi:hypothetical protein